MTERFIIQGGKIQHTDVYEIIDTYTNEPLISLMGKSADYLKKVLHILNEQERRIEHLAQLLEQKQ